jgi:hypothetical protein
MAGVEIMTLLRSCLRPSSRAVMALVCAVAMLLWLPSGAHAGSSRAGATEHHGRSAKSKGRHGPRVRHRAGRRARRARPAVRRSNRRAPRATLRGRDEFHVGVVAGSALVWELPFIREAGASSARLEFDIATPAAEIAPIVDDYVRAGVKPLLLAGFHGRLPTIGEARNVAGWAAAFGPRGTHWHGATPENAVTQIEFGNETSYSYQFSDTAGRSGFSLLPAYAGRARVYAIRVKEAARAMESVGARVGLLATADPGGGGSAWVDGMFAAVPDLDRWVAGWTVHPYGPASRWMPIMDEVISSTRAWGASETTPLYVTEYGIASDDGTCLDHNYGWDPCMTYDAAGSALRSTIGAMRDRYRSRLRGLYLFQAHDQRGPSQTTSAEGYFGAMRLDHGAKGAYTREVVRALGANP